MGISIKDYINGAGFDFDPILDGEFHRFSTGDRSDKSGWQVGTEIINPAFKEPLVILNFGDWSTAESFSYISKTRFDKNQKIIKDKEIEKINKIINNQKEIEQKKASQMAKDFIAIAEPLKIHSYLDKKKIKSYCLFKDKEYVVIPVYQSFDRNDISSLQRINQNGFKQFMPGGMVKGGFFWIDGNTDKIFICEGYATGASIYEATGNLVVVAFNAGNLYSVSEKIINKYKKSEIVICADNDQFSEKNVGINNANKIALDFKIKIKIPKFKNLSSKPTDFNDLFLLEGIDEVRTQLADENFQEVKPENMTDEYHFFELFFNKFLINTVREKFTDSLLFVNDKNHAQYSQVFNAIPLLRSYAHDNNLNRSFVEDHLNRWTSNRPLETLIKPKKWDGRDRISDILCNIGFKNIDSDLAIELFKHWFSKIFSRVENESNQNEFLILRGPQGAGKDRLIKAILSEAFTNYYFCNIAVHKNIIENFQTMAGKLVINIPEFDSTHSMSMSDLKTMITTDSAFFRPPFGRKPQRVTFHCSFISSVNFDDILRDTSGNRRFSIIECDKINWGYDKHLNHEQLLAQFYYLFESNYVPSSDAILARDKILAKETPDHIKEYLNFEFNKLFSTLSAQKQRKEFNMEDISDDLNKLSKMYQVSVKFLLRSLKEMGYSKRESSGMVYRRMDEKH